MYIGILGGSFNPVHIGHIRLAIEILECQLFPTKLDRLDLIPCSIAPHKSNSTILPFDLRLKMLEASIKNIPNLHANALENARKGPSYTYDTLSIYKEKYPKSRLLFLVGGEDFSHIPTWFNGLKLPELADIGMVPRAGNNIEMFQSEIKKHWPSAKFSENKTPQASLENGSNFYYLPLPRLDISASYIRKLWQQDKNIRMLMPHEALEILYASSTKVNQIWQHKEV